MITLNLKRKHRGIYEVEAGEILVNVSNPYLSDGISQNRWQLIIIEKTDYKELLNEWFPTKKEASEFGARWIIRNL